MNEDRNAQRAVGEEQAPDAPRQGTIVGGPDARAKVNENDQAQADVEGEDRSGNNPTQATLPAGPHARSKATDESKTPGTGALPDQGSRDIDAGSE